MLSQSRLLNWQRDDSLLASAGQKQFKLLVRHLLDRFFNNEIVSVDGETLPLIMTVAWAIALPTLVATIFLFPAYHQFSPRPPRPPFWGRVADHYGFVMYAWVVMGAITVFEWDLLVPNILDVFVLSVLPIGQRNFFWQDRGHSHLLGAFSVRHKLVGNHFLSLGHGAGRCSAGVRRSPRCCDSRRTLCCVPGSGFAGIAH